MELGKCESCCSWKGNSRGLRTARHSSADFWTGKFSGILLEAEDADEPKKLLRKGIVGIEDFKKTLCPADNVERGGMRGLCVKVDKVRKMRRKLAAWG